MSREPRKLSTLESMEYRRLQAILRRVRSRWRAKLLLRGLGVLLLLGLATVALAAWGLDLWGNRPTAAVALGVFTYVALGWMGWSLVVRPLLYPVPDRRVALYIEERAPQIQAALLSAVEFGDPEEKADRHDISPEFVDRVIHEALDRGREIDYGKGVERQDLRRVGGFVGAATMVVAAALLVSPGFLRDGLPMLMRPWSVGGTAATPYAVAVQPGNVEIARGADQVVTAGLDGFDAEEVRLAVKGGADGEWERVPMSVDPDRGGFVAMILGVEEPTDYFVEAGGVRSPIYRLDVVEVPYVERLELELVYPEYSGLSPDVREEGGDIAALEGTRVRLRAHPTVDVPAGRIRFEGAGPGRDDVEGAVRDGVATLPDDVALEPTGDGSLEGEFTVRSAGYYQVWLEGWDEGLHEASRRYVIEVLDDQPPTLSFDTPGRDVSVSSIEEVFTEVAAEDDFGITELELVYTVNGGEERTVPLYEGDAGTESPLELTAAHTFYLEEEPLEPGDFVSYWARATDNRGAGGGETNATDIYFLEVRPFDRELRQSQQGMIGGGGGGGRIGADLSRRQREVVAATFKLVRDADRTEPERREEDAATVTEAQATVREQTLAMGSTFGGMGGGEQVMEMMQLLSEAGDAMGEAVELLEERELQDALGPEQRALQKLQRVEASFRDMRLSMQQGGGGGAAGNLDEIADMFDLEMEELRNQYESVRRERQEQADDEVDEALQRLTELARRQQQEIERQRAQTRRQSGAAAGTGGAQRRLAEEAEELARQLERLARDRARRDLQDAANRLRDATDAMRQAATRSGEDAASESSRALSELQNARRLLDRDRRGRLQRDLADARQRVDRMREMQRRIEEDVDRLGTAGGRTPERVESLMERKDRLSEEIRDLEAQLDDMGRAARGDQLRASRELQETAEWIRDSKLSDKVRYSKGVVQERDPGYARGFEEGISEELRSLEERVEAAAGAVERSRDERLAETVEGTRDLVRRLESFERRLQERRQRRLGDRRGPEEGDSGQASGPEGERAGAGADEAGPEGAPSSRLGGSTDGVPGRQLGRELRERVRDAEALREALEGEGLQTTDLDRVIAAMRELPENWDGTDRGLERLRADVIDDLKLFEFWLRRITDRTGGDRPQLAGGDAVPEGYRSMVEEYFRSLAEEGNGR